MEKTSYMGLYFLGFLICFFINGVLCESNVFSMGTRISLSVPPKYEVGFQGKAFPIKIGGKNPIFKAGLSVEAINGRYACSLVVVFGELQVWNSDGFWTSTSCVIELMNGGDLQLKDSSGRIGWRTGTSGQGVERLQLLRTGNLVLTDNKNNIKWQSFDFPGSIMLWSQTLNTSSRLTSFAGSSASFFSFEIQESMIAMYLNSGNKKYSYWEFKSERSRSPRKIAFIQLGSTGLKLFDPRSRKFAQILSQRPEPIRLLALGSTGNLGIYHYSAVEGKFKASFLAINSTCDLPLSCGPYGICTKNNTCVCMRFSARTELSDFSCDEEFSGSFCDSNDALEMVEIKGVTSVLRSAPHMVNGTREECENSCMEDCSCVAALYSGGRVPRFRRECFHYGLVLGVKQVERGVGLNYMVKVPKRIAGVGGSSSSVKNWVLVLGWVINGLALLLILGGLVWYLVVIRRRKKVLEGENA